jgi:hypothetical protein
MNRHHRAHGSKDSLKSVPLALLKEKLNAVYRQAKAQSGAPFLERFNLLWDLKEKALLEGKEAIDVPHDWLSELDLVDAANPANERLKHTS